MNTLPYHERYQILNPLAAGGSGCHDAGGREPVVFAYTYTPIVHQDVKPGNFLYYPVNSSQRAVYLYLCDFGISRLQPSEPAFASEVIGTAAYMAPDNLPDNCWPPGLPHTASSPPSTISVTQR